MDAQTTANRRGRWALAALAGIACACALLCSCSPAATREASARESGNPDAIRPGVVVSPYEEASPAGEELEDGAGTKPEEPAGEIGSENGPDVLPEDVGQAPVAGDSIEDFTDAELDAMRPTELSSTTEFDTASAWPLSMAEKHPDIPQAVIARLPNDIAEACAAAGGREVNEIVVGNDVVRNGEGVAFAALAYAGADRYVLACSYDVGAPDDHTIEIMP